jgi:hypothetical protein
MPKQSASIVIRASCEAVFDLIHDYDRRLQWDSLLRKAYLCDGVKQAGKGVCSVCAAKWIVGGTTIKSEYVTYERGKVAAVKMLNTPPFFRAFAATILHELIDEQRSRVTYTYNFKAKPSWLAWLLEPIMNFLLFKEIKGRLKALKAFLEK